MNLFEATGTPSDSHMVKVLDSVWPFDVGGSTMRKSANNGSYFVPIEFVCIIKP